MRDEVTSGAATMRAIVMSKFGKPEVLTVRQVPRPEPVAGEVRVRVAADAERELSELEAADALGCDAVGSAWLSGKPVWRSA